MRTIGITGGIGSGKSTVCRIFEWLKVPVYYADDRAKQLMQEDPGLVESIGALLGEQAYSNGRLNRAYIASRIFNDADLLQALNALVHPAVAKDFETWAIDRKQEGHAYVIKEAALLIETDAYKLLDELIVVSADKELRIRRVMERDNCDREQVLARMRHQFPQSEKDAMADHLIVNDGEQSLLAQVSELHRALKAH